MTIWIRLEAGTGNIYPSSITFALLKQVRSLYTRKSGFASFAAHHRLPDDILQAPFVQDLIHHVCCRALNRSFRNKARRSWARNQKRLLVWLLLYHIADGIELTDALCFSLLNRMCQKYSSSGHRDKVIWWYIEDEASFVVKASMVDEGVPDLADMNPNKPLTPSEVGPTLYEAHLYEKCKPQFEHSEFTCVLCVDYGIVKYDGTDFSQTSHNNVCATFPTSVLSSFEDMMNDNHDEDSEDEYETCDEDAEDEVTVQESQSCIGYIVTAKQRGYLSLEDMEHFMTQRAKQKLLENLLGLLKHIHSFGLFHCDLHTNNILCTMHGDVCLFDLDLACFFPHNDSLIFDDFEYNLDLVKRYLESTNGPTFTKAELAKAVDYYYVLYSSELYTSLPSHHSLQTVVSMYHKERNRFRQYKKKHAEFSDASFFTKAACCGLRVMSAVASSQKDLF